MINAKELRTGSILQYFIEEEGKWHYTTLGWHDIKWCDVNQVNFNKLHVPVELTPEILEKCGFNVTSKGFYQHPNWYNVSLKHLRGTYNLRCNFMDIIANNIDYLHQLQNLFYSLTGEELNFLPS